MEKFLLVSLLLSMSATCFGEFDSSSEISNVKMAVNSEENNIAFPENDNGYYSSEGDYLAMPGASLSDLQRAPAVLGDSDLPLVVPSEGSDD